MSLESLKAEKASIEKQIETYLEELTSNREEIISLAKVYVNNQLQLIVENQVKAKSEHTKSLGIDSLKEMKQKLNQMLLSSDEIVENLFLDDGVWLHMGYKTNADDYLHEQDYRITRKSENKIVTVIKIALGSAGDLLAEYGYTKISSSLNYPTSEWGRIATKTAYIHSIALDKDLDASIDKYNKGLSDLHDYYMKLDKISTKISEQEATDMWDSI